MYGNYANLVNNTVIEFKSESCFLSDANRSSLNKDSALLSGRIFFLSVFFPCFFFLRKLLFGLKIDLEDQEIGDNSKNEQTRVRCDQGGEKVGKR